MIEVLLAAGADVEARNDNDSTPLHNAARNNEALAVIQALLAAGADVEARKRPWHTPPRSSLREPERGGS